MKTFYYLPLSAKVEINNKQATALSPIAIVVLEAENLVAKTPTDFALF